jgi:tRNA 5-methylaminomethyl-2-thiouridine biosynthesis bifunctional protein
MDLQWREMNKPFSTDFDDIYYGDEDGLQEGRYIYLENNQIPERFLKTSQSFVIAETGFGTGLNFLATWDLWKKSRNPSAKWLHYISCEKFPLTKTQIERALSRWPELAPLTEKFLEAYHDFPPGFHRILFSDEKLSLTLCIGDAFTSLKQMNTKVDAWYLDGFSPRKNPEMWNAELFEQVARLSDEGTTYATFTCAGHIRRNLQSVGFEVQKFLGFGRKREMQKGVFKLKRPAGTVISTPQKRVTIVGGGLAGISAAYHLAKRGISVKLIERQSEISQGASGNVAAITLPVLTAEPTVLSRMTFAGFLFLKNIQRELFQNQASKSPFYKNKGLLQICTDAEKFQKRIRGIESSGLPSSLARSVTADEASEIAGLQLPNAAIYFPEAESIHLPSLCREMLSSHSNLIEVQTNATALAFKEKNQQWEIFDSAGQCISESDHLILANAYDVASFKETSWLPLRKIRGQMMQIESSPALKNLRSILCFEKYLSPKLDDGSHLLGATYDNNDLSETVRENENQEMIKDLTESIPCLENENFKVRASRVSFRTSVPGQAPAVGELYSTDGSPLKNIFALTSFSSRGSIYGLLCGEILASKIAEDPLPIEEDLSQMISPQRFHPLEKSGR